nr:nuclear transport factor 2 family protein [Streptomyces sp. SA15]
MRHNPLAADGPEAMKAFGAGMREQFPDATLEVRRALSEGDLVLLHSRGVLVPGTPGMAVFDIFRFQDGQIAAEPSGDRSLPARTWITGANWRIRTTSSTASSSGTRYPPTPAMRSRPAPTPHR